MKADARVTSAALKVVAVALIQVERLTNRFGNVGVLRVVNGWTRKFGDVLKEKYFPK